MVSRYKNRQYTCDCSSLVYWNVSLHRDSRTIIFDLREKEKWRQQGRSICTKFQALHLVVLYIYIYFTFAPRFTVPDACSAAFQIRPRRVSGMR